jgi:histone acetyltransferase (RNA polymerase elongator complex component)
VWNVIVTRADRILTIEVVEQKSVYTLLGYRNYTRHGDDRAVLVEPGLETVRLDHKRLEVELTSASTALALFELALDRVSCGRGDLELLDEGVGYAGTLKGTEALKTCTFGCVYCPTEVDADGEQMNPKSYLTHESGVIRAVRNGYNTADQVYDRLGSLQSMGHDTSKVFVRIVGGTWSVLTRNAQQTFVRDTLFALNTIDVPPDSRRQPLSLEEEQVFNETASCRAVEICVEDHPKMVTPASLLENRRLGITAMEIGVQTTNDEIHRITKRDSSRAQIVERTKLMKEFGFKVLAHLMPDLPGSSPEMDHQMIDDVLHSGTTRRVRDIRAPAIFAIPVATAAVAGAYGLAAAAIVACILLGVVLVVEWYCSHTFDFAMDFDRFKLYPTMVLEFSELKSWYHDGRYTPYFDKDPEALYSVIQHFLEGVHPYQRVERVVRDIPASRSPDKPSYVVGGIDVTNAQQIVERRMENKCLCLRSREVKEALAPDATQARLFRHRYYASDGEEWFLSFESVDRRWVYGFLKLRFNNDPYKPYLPKEILGACIVRWLQVYGRAIGVGSAIAAGGPGTAASSSVHQGRSQHRGLGQRLMAEAERIARSKGACKLADISGIGVREYYRNIGFRLEGSYMVKDLL